jgi:ABC-type phosphate/phosphonate transport system substrate-binding protein
MLVAAGAASGLRHAGYRAIESCRLEKGYLYWSSDISPVTTPLEAGLKDFWQRPDLLLSQTCGMPYRHLLKDKVTLVGTPDFGLDGCAPGCYRSAIIVRADDPRESLADFAGATFACNETMSQSGFAAPLVAAQAAGVRFGTQRLSDAHALSARMVAEGQADIAGIDAVSWRHMCRYDPWTVGMRVLTWTEPTPGLIDVLAQRIVIGLPGSDPTTGDR